jgi:hypothetical protein
MQCAPWFVRRRHVCFERRAVGVSRFKYLQISRHTFSEHSTLSILPLAMAATTIDITISYADGDSVLPFQVEADETVENLKALIEAMVRSIAFTQSWPRFGFRPFLPSRPLLPLLPRSPQFSISLFF